MVYYCFLNQDDVCLSSLENQAVDLTIPLKGGKVHGSLARAGKVRGQTPKVWSPYYDFFSVLCSKLWRNVLQVEAGEKKKKKTGRAKRRIQYNRR